jgi:hypothetical protein
MRREQKGGAGLAVTVVVVLLLLPVFYVVSVGPANWLLNHRYLGERTAITIYYPLLILAENCEPVQNALSAYCEFCSPTPNLPTPLPSTPPPGAPAYGH